MSLSDIQKDIVDTKGNLIVSASAGTGKTHTMVAKIEKELQDNHSHKVIAAITFTIRAAKEIRDRIKINSSDSFIGTNNSFAIEEIIQPFAKDVYGKEYDIDISTDYSVRKQSFNECMNYLKNKHVICSYTDNKKNFVFELALKIIKKSDVCRKFLKSKYFKIYIDEYQDCDKMMHEFFMYICEQLSIELFIVGDDKQSIYIWRGAYPEAFKSIFSMPNFKKNKLRDNYRSCRQIQNYSNLLDKNTMNLYSKVDDLSSIVLVSSTSDNWVNDIVQYIDMSNECALLRYKNSDANIGAKLLSKTGTKFTYVPKTPISEITTDTAWLYSSVAQYIILDKYSVYDFIDDIPEESIGDKRIKIFLETTLSTIATAIKTHNFKDATKQVHCIAKYFNYVANDKHIDAMVETIINSEYHPAFRMNELKHTALTVHSSKGLEYEQVIVIANDYTLADDTSIYNHYVAVTRAKTKLVIVKLNDATNSWSGNKYYENLKKILSAKNISPKEILTIV